MAVAVDATGSAGISGTGVSSFNYTGLTIGAGLSNSALIASFAFLGNDVTGVSATWNGVSLSKITGASFPSGNTGQSELWGLINPASGNQTLAISFTPGVQPGNLTACAMSFTGVNQTGGATSFPNSTTANGTAASSSITVTSAVGDYTCAVHTPNSNSQTISSTNQTTLYTDNSNHLSTGANYATGAATVNLTATWTGSIGWVSAATDIAAAGAAAHPLRFNANLDGLSASGGFFRDPLARTMLGWRKGILIPRSA